MIPRGSLGALLERELSAHRTVRPPWVALPGTHPLDDAWAHGEGEAHLLVWGLWLGSMAPVDAWEKALAVVKAHAPLPADWAFWALDALGLATEEDPYEHSFEEAKDKLSAVGVTVAGTLSAR